MLCGFCKDQDIYDVDFMYELVDSLVGKFQNLDISHCNIWKMIGHDSLSHAGLDDKKFLTIGTKLRATYKITIDTVNLGLSGISSYIMSTWNLCYLLENQMTNKWNLNITYTWKTHL